MSLPSRPDGAWCFKLCAARWMAPGVAHRAAPCVPTDVNKLFFCSPSQLEELSSSMYPWLLFFCCFVSSSLKWRRLFSFTARLQPEAEPRRLPRGPADRQHVTHPSPPSDPGRGGMPSSSSKHFLSSAAPVCTRGIRGKDAPATFSFLTSSANPSDLRKHFRFLTRR